MQGKLIIKLGFDETDKLFRKKENIAESRLKITLMCQQF